MGVGERIIKEMVDAGELPAYKIGGAFLRFKKSQLVLVKTSLQGKGIKKEEVQYDTETTGERREAIKDFLYFNDFYILSVIVIVIAVVLIVAT